MDGIEHAQHLIEIASAAHRIDQHQLDLLVRTNNEHRSHGGVVCGRAAIAGGSRLGGQHVIELSHLQFGIADHGEGNFGALRFFDVTGPFAVTGHRVDAQADNFRVPLGELRLQAGHVSQFGGAYRSEILGVRKQDGPAIAYPFVKIDRALRGFGGEVGSFRIDA